MSRRYDSRTTTFSPDGRLHQVEYALESVTQASTVIAILAPFNSFSTSTSEPKPDAAGEDVKMEDASGATGSTTVPRKTAETDADDSKLISKTTKSTKAGLVIAAEKRVTSKLLDKEKGSMEKIFVVNGNIMTGVAGLTADANALVNMSRIIAQDYLAEYDEDMPVEKLVKRLSDIKHQRTQFGGLRPYGVSILYAGFDPHHRLQLYSSDPSGNYSGYKAIAVGGKARSTAEGLLKQAYRDDLGLEEAQELALKVLSKTLDSTTLDSEKIEFATLTVGENDKVHVHVHKPDEIDALLKTHELSKEPEPES